MTDRVLPPEEWGKLPPCDLATVRDRLDPRVTMIAVVEDEAGRILACWAAMTMVHVEGVWIDPAYRKSSVALRLWRRMQRIVHEWGATSVLTGANTPEITALLTRKRATPLPYQEYVLCL
jgi:hypothetical protein